MHVTCIFKGFPSPPSLVPGCQTLLLGHLDRGERVVELTHYYDHDKNLTIS